MRTKKNPLSVLNHLRVNYTCFLSHQVGDASVGRVGIGAFVLQNSSDLAANCHVRPAGMIPVQTVVNVWIVGSLSRVNVRWAGPGQLATKT